MHKFLLGLALLLAFSFSYAQQPAPTNPAPAKPVPAKPAPEQPAPANPAPAVAPPAVPTAKSGDEKTPVLSEEEKNCVPSPKLEVLQSFWMPKITNLKTNDEALALWSALNKCSIAAKNELVEIRAKFLQAAVKKNWAPTVTAATNWSTALLSAPEKVAEAALWVPFVSGLFGDVVGSLPIQLNMLTAVFGPTLPWMTKNAAKLNTVEKLTWSSTMKDIYQNRGDLQKVIEVVSLVQPDLLKPEGKSYIPTHIFSACSAFRFYGQYSRCADFLKPFASSFGLIADHQTATTDYETGKLKESLVVYQKIAANYRDNNLAQKWALLTIAQLKFHMGDVKGSAEAMANYDAYLASHSADWFDKIHTNTVKQRFARERGDFKTCWTIIAQQKDLIAKTFNGRSLEGTRLLFETFLTAVKQKDPAKIDETRKALEPAIQPLAADNFFKLATLYVDKKRAGQPATAEQAALNKVRPLKNFEFTSIQSALGIN